MQTARKVSGWERLRPDEVRRIATSQLPEYMEWLLDQPSGYPCINVLERILREPGRTNKQGHRVLAKWPPRRLQRINQAFGMMDEFPRRVLMLKYGLTRLDDGSPITDRDRADAAGLCMSDWDRLLARSKDQLVVLMRGLDTMQGFRQNTG
jgi:hypothetical protein